jgi:hypothetical protein
MTPVPRTPGPFGTSGPLTTCSGPRNVRSLMATMRTSARTPLAVRFEVSLAAARCAFRFTYFSFTFALFTGT